MTIGIVGTRPNASQGSLAKTGKPDISDVAMQRVKPATFVVLSLVCHH
jgi:hypothetical protein